MTVITQTVITDLEVLDVRFQLPRNWMAQTP